jgi:Domain of unknown function (DUF4178)
MKVQCSNCGAPVEFRFDDSLVRVCGSCKSAIVRTDRGVETLGKMADLVPMDSPLKLFSDGKYFGRGFMLIGKAQIQHSAGGIWQEWYAKFDDGRWGWIAEHQGRFSVSFEVPDMQGLPTANAINAGTQVSVGGPQPYTVTEVGVAKYLAADGELPFRLGINESFLFADMSDGVGGFATLDYGDPDQPTPTPTMYAGQWVALAALGIAGGEAAPRDATPAAGKKLACPECNGSIDVRLPDASMRVVCPYCNQMISTENGVLALLGMLAVKAKPEIPLGTRAKFAQQPDTEFVVVGYMKRSAYVDHSWYSFDEYLLHNQSVGFQWLVCSDGHWSFVQPVDTAAITINGQRDASYQDVTFKAFAGYTMRVDEVYGEFFWRVNAGDMSSSVDSIAPPAMLSRELEGKELNTSLATYLTASQVRAATGVSVVDRAVGVAPNSPLRLPYLGWISALAFIVLTATAMVLAGRAHPHQVLEQVFSVPPGKPALPPPPVEAGFETPPVGEEAPGNAFFSEPFDVKAGENLEFTFGASLSNSWAYVVVDLYDEATGQFVSVNRELEKYSGYEDGESWSEGDDLRTLYISPIKAGNYIARIEAIHGSNTDISVFVRIRQNVFRWVNYLGFAIALLVLLGIAGLFRFFHNKKRWSNSGFYGPPGAYTAAEDQDDEDDDDE